MNSAAAMPPSSGPDLCELMSDGFHLLLLLSRGWRPDDAESFVQTLGMFLDALEQDALHAGIAAEDIDASR